MLRLLLASTVLFVVQHLGTALAPLPGVKEYEVVYPQKLYSRHKRDTTAKYPDDVHYGLKVDGKDLVLQLKRNEDLLAPGYTETHYLPNGQEVTKQPPISDHCYYHGFIGNDSDSEASISTCKGLSGYFGTEGQRYLIEPLKLAEGEEHAVYKYEDLESTPKTCGVTNTTFEEGPSIKRSRSGSNADKQEFLKAKKYIKLYMVADKSMYEKYNRSEAEVRQKLYEVVNYVNLVYKSINTFVALIGIEIWSNVDKIKVNSAAGTTLDLFTAWRKDDLLKRKPNDNAQFLTNIDYDGPTVGLAFLKTMCSKDHSTGVIQDHSRSSIAVGATVAHEMGHNLGMSHDSSSCTCPQPSCIMAASLSYITPKDFSTCSHQYFQEFILNYMPECMRNAPQVKDILSPAVCGNGFIEDGEACDCGTPAECTNPCCDAATCTLKPEAKCADGECCENCQIKKMGIVCRPSKHDCDLPDSCNGKSATCPSDRFRVNGFPCKNGQGFCYMGTCPLLQSQCTNLWGASAVRGADSCFQTNTRGLYYGFCTYSEGSFVRCAPKDAVCGKLYCTGGSDSIPIPSTQITLGACKTLVPSSGYEDNFVMVQNGTKCGDGLVCYKGTCVDIESAYRSTNCSNKCQGHGVCDHELQCQCEEGWEPPNCDNVSGKSIVVIIVVVLIIAVTIVAVLVLLWYRGTFKSKLQRSQPNTVSGLTNPGYEQKRNQAVIVHTPELTTRSLLPSPPTPPDQADKPRISFMSTPEGRHLPTRVGYSSPQYAVASPSSEDNQRRPYNNPVKLIKPSTQPPPVPINKPAGPQAQSTFGPVPSGKPALRTAPAVPTGKPVLPTAPPKALKPPSSRPKI